MKKNLPRTITRIVGDRVVGVRSIGIVALLAVVASPLAIASEPVESGAGKVCGILKNFQGEIQVFDSSRTHLGDVAFGTKLRCGDWISVEKGKAVIEHFTGSALAVSDRSFVQILDPQSGENPDRAHFTLYRGEMLVSAPEKRGKKPAMEVAVVTPNAIIRVRGGAAYALYSTSADESQAIGLGGEATIENRFFQGKKMKAGFAQFVAFADPVERLVPEAARYVNPRDLNDRLAKLAIPQEIRDRVETVVRAGAKTRMPTTLATQEKVEAPEAGEFRAVSRAPASVSSHPSKKAVAKKSRPRVRENELDFSLKRQVSEAEEKRKLLQALSSIRPDEE